jgi:signal peptidase
MASPEKDPKSGLVRDILSVVITVAVIGVLLFGLSGTWPAIVAVESESMVPNMQVGDLVFVVAKDRFGPVLTSPEAEAQNVTSFGGYGDVIIYQPNGNSGVTPIIHRATGWVNATEADRLGFIGSHEGYVTKGDNNGGPDQLGTFQRLGRVEPVRDEWIVGKAVFAIPFIGYLPLHLWEFAAVVIIILIASELYSRRKEHLRKLEEEKQALQAKGRKKK